MGQDPLAELPRELARMPEVWTRLLARHTAARDGRCRECRTQAGPGPRWPCTLYELAVRAQRVAAARDR